MISANMVGTNKGDGDLRLTNVNNLLRVSSLYCVVAEHV